MITIWICLKIKQLYFGKDVASSENPMYPGWGPSTAFIVGARNGTFYIDETGGSASHNNVQPYVVTYMWKRIQ